MQLVPGGMALKDGSMINAQRRVRIEKKTKTFKAELQRKPPPSYKCFAIMTNPRFTFFRQ